MNTAEAMAQIQTVMSAAEEPVACVLLETIYELSHWRAPPV